ncbi:MAG TPA: methyltransferase, partial [Actinomycetota bacterium]|nr:methyltransferase [Actinomycetota bacterium]
LLDRICRDAPAHLQPGGAILVVHSSICGTDQTLEDFARAQMMRERGLLGPDDSEEIVVVRGRLSERLVGS